MPRYIQDKKTGQMKGAIPDGKAAPPSPNPVPPKRDTDGEEATPDMVSNTYGSYRRAIETAYTRRTVQHVAEDMGVQAESLTEVFESWRNAEPGSFEDTPSPHRQHRYDLDPDAPQDAASQRALRKLGYEHHLATPHPVFVYGTLRAGQHNSHLMSGARAETRAATVDGIAIYGSSYGFPYAAEHDDPSAVTQGEVVWLTEDDAGDTARYMLDHLEGFNSNFPSNSHYERVEKEIRAFNEETGEEETVTAWVYLARGSARQHLREQDRIQDGDWVRRQHDFDLPTKSTYFNRFRT